MKFKLGQKVSYKRISKKKDMSGENYTTLANFEYDDDDDDDGSMTKERRETIILEKPRTGYISGRRRVVLKTVLVEIYNYEPGETDYIDIQKQIYGMVYLVAWSFGKMDYVLEEDIVPTIYSNDDIYKAKGE